MRQCSILGGLPRESLMMPAAEWPLPMKRKCLSGVRNGLLEASNQCSDRSDLKVGDGVLEGGGATEGENDALLAPPQQRSCVLLPLCDYLMPLQLQHLIPEC